MVCKKIKPFTLHPFGILLIVLGCTIVAVVHNVALLKGAKEQEQKDKDKKEEDANKPKGKAAPADDEGEAPAEEEPEEEPPGEE